jgi:hypothetical protein
MDRMHVQVVTASSTPYNRGVRPEQAPGGVWGCTPRTSKRAAG